MTTERRHEACRKRQRGEGLKRSGRAPLLEHEDPMAGRDLDDLGVTVEVVEEGAPGVSVAGEAAPAHLGPGLVKRRPDVWVPRISSGPPTWEFSV